MKTHYSCAELAALKLAGFPTAKKNWIALVQREGWGKRPRVGRGGGHEYAPPAAVLELIRKQLAIEVVGEGDDVTLTLRVSRAEAGHIIRWLRKGKRHG